MYSTYTVCTVHSRLHIKAKHIKAKHPVRYDVLYNVAVPTRANKRVRYTNAQKSHILDKHWEHLLDPTCLTPTNATAKWAFGCNWFKRKGYISRWLHACGQIRSQVKNGINGGQARRNGRTRKPDYPDCEDELYVRFLFRRTARGFPCNHYWLQKEFENILDEVTPTGYTGRRYSKGWAVRFCVRYSITTQAKNNIKAHDQLDRLEAIRGFHRFLIMSLQQSAPQLDTKYGRFSPERILHVDQVPLPFASDRTKTLNPRGAKSCRIAGVNTSGLEKRQATLQLWICALGKRQYIKPTIIFRGGRGPRSKVPWDQEKALYDSLDNIRVAFQQNAWADEIFCQQEILQVAGDIADAGIAGEVLIGMDNHSAQRTPGMLALYTELGMVPVFTAANCTDCISPVDHHIGRYIQAHMGRSYDVEIEKRPDIWIATAEEQELDDPACRGAMARRMLMAQWLSAAWTELCANKSHMIDSAFVKTGFLVAKDGSEDHLIDIQGWSAPTPYSYRD
jgi:hypothetical protein